MSTAARALCALCLALAPLPLPAQQGDAFVLPPGMVRVRGTAEFSHFDARFAPDGGTEPLAGGLAAPLTSRTFAPLLPVETELNRFFAAVAPGAIPADPQSLRLGTLDLAADANLRVVPLSLAAGVMRRLEVGVSLPLMREEVVLTRFALADGTVGANPDPQANADLLARIAPEWSGLGGSPLLPTESSALGRELQRLVGMRLPGETLNLPDSAATTALLGEILQQQFGLAPLEPGLGPWRVGDAEVSGRFQLVSTLGSLPLPTDSTGLHYRAALNLSARLPTGTEPDPVRLLGFLPEVGLGGWSIGVDGDLFLDRRFWTTFSLQYSRRSEAEVVRRVVAPSAPLSSLAPARPVLWSPADRLALRAAPRFRLTEALSLGAQYSLARLGESRFEAVDGAGDGAGDAGVLDLPGGIAHAAGIGVRYSTLPAYWEGRGLLPLEVVLGYETTLGAPSGRPDASVLVLQASVFHGF